MKVAAFMSKSKAWNPFKKGKAGRDIASELYILIPILKAYHRNVAVWRTPISN